MEPEPTALNSGADSTTITAAASSPPISQIFGPYRTLQLLGEGGMGAVYLAEQREPIQRRVALKVIKLGMDSRDVIARFESERQALALMDHPNIARVLDAGTSDNGRPYFVMEYVPGLPLTQYCDRHRLNNRERLGLFRQVCQAIQHAHQKGVIHRDVKPSNILVEVVDGKPVPKVIDFGVAKATGQRLTEKTLFTQLGAMIGTPEYMSPEQAGLTQLDVDSTTDIYSLGVVLYELLVGALPFDSAELRRAGYAEICRVIREEEPPKPTTKLESLGATGVEVASKRHTDVRTLVRQVRGDLEWITMKALEKDRLRRYASASELAADIERHLNDEPVTAGAPSSLYRLQKFTRKHKRTVAAVTAVVVALAAGVVVSSALYLSAERQRDQAIQQSYIANIHAADLHLKGLEEDAAKRKLLLCDPRLRGWEWRQLWHRADASLATLYGIGFAENWPSSFLAFSSDGARIYRNTNFAVEVWDGWSYERIANYGGIGKILAMSRDQPKLLVQASGGLHLIDPATSATVASLEYPDNVVYGALSPDGRTAALMSKENTLRIWDLTLAKEIATVQGSDPVAFSQDGSRISVHVGIGRWQIRDVRSGELSVIETESWTAPVFSPTASEVAAANGNEVRIWDIRSRALRKTLLGHEGEVLAVAYSPDGSRLASASSDYTVRMWDVGSGELLATFTTATGPITLAFSPDGTRLVAADRQGVSRVWDIALPGGAVFKRTDTEIRAVALSQDGAKLAVAVEDGAVEIRHAASGKLLLNCCKRGTVALAFNPDGSRLASGDRLGAVRLYDAGSGQELAALPGHSARISSLAFNPSGTHLVSGSLDGTARVWDASSSRVLATLDLRDPVHSATFSPKGDRILTASGNRETRSGSKETVQIWDWRNGTKLTQLAGGDSGTTSIAMAAVFSPDGNSIAAAFDSGGELSFWDTSTWKRTGVASLGDGGITTIAYSPDGSRFVTRALSNGATRVWDAATYEPLITLSTDRTSQHFTAFSLDGSRLFCALNSSVRVWNTRSSYYPGAAEYVNSLHKPFPLASERLAHLQGDRKLDPNLRLAAIKLVELRGERVEVLNSMAWSVVKTPDLPAAHYRAPLQWAQAAAKAAQWHPGILNTLAVAQYRNSQYRDALASCRRSEELTSRRIRSNLIFTAMAHFQLGETAAARAELQRVQEMAKLAISMEDQGFIREAEALVFSSKK